MHASDVFGGVPDSRRLALEPTLPRCKGWPPAPRSMA